MQQKITPNHIAIIMDGNGRWAKQRGKFRAVGHRAGLKTVKKTVQHCSQLGIKVLTLYAFSSENWRRPEQEVSALMSLFIHALNKEVKALHKNNIKLNVIGDVSRFSSQLQNMILNAEQLTANNSGLILNIAANYGGRWDITHAVKAIAHAVKQNELEPNDIDEALLNEYMLLSELPDVDLVIRTGGEHRISNFLLWQAAYAEFYFINTLWPDFDQGSLEKALDAFNQRERRFGGVLNLEQN